MEIAFVYTGERRFEKIGKEIAKNANPEYKFL